MLFLPNFAEKLSKEEKKARLIGRKQEGHYLGVKKKMTSETKFRH